MISKCILCSIYFLNFEATSNVLKQINLKIKKLRTKNKNKKWNKQPRQPKIAEPHNLSSTLMLWSIQLRHKQRNVPVFFQRCLQIHLYLKKKGLLGKFNGMTWNICESSPLAYGNSQIVLNLKIYTLSLLLWQNTNPDASLIKICCGDQFA